MITRSTITLAAIGGAISCLAIVQTARADPLERQQAIYQAIGDISRALEGPAATSAYMAVEAADRDDLRLNQAFVRRMVDLGTPEDAYLQARIVEAQAPDDGLTQAVISFNEARAGKMVEALRDIVLAYHALGDDPFVQRTAGQLVAWLDQGPQGIEMPDYLRQAVAEMAEALADDPAFADAYSEARAAYAELTAAEGQVPADEGDVGYDAGDVAIVPGDYVAPGFYANCVWNPSLVVFVGVVHSHGLLCGRFFGGDLIVDHRRRVFVGRMHSLHSRRDHDDHGVIVTDAHRLVRSSRGRLGIAATAQTLLSDNHGTFVGGITYARRQSGGPAGPVPTRAAAPTAHAAPLAAHGGQPPTASFVRPASPRRTEFRNDSAVSGWTAGSEDRDRTVNAVPTLGRGAGDRHVTFNREQPTVTRVQTAPPHSATASDPPRRRAFSPAAPPRVESAHSSAPTFGRVGGSDRGVSTPHVAQHGFTGQSHFSSHGSSHAGFAPSPSHAGSMSAHSQAPPHGGGRRR